MNVLERLQKKSAATKKVVVFGALLALALPLLFLVVHNVKSKMAKQAGSLNPLGNLDLPGLSGGSETLEEINNLLNATTTTTIGD